MKKTDRGVPADRPTDRLSNIDPRRGGQNGRTVESTTTMMQWQGTRTDVDTKRHTDRETDCVRLRPGL